MPEGDTILRTAQTLARVLVGKPMVAARATDPAIDAALRARIGAAPVAIEARGKHLLIRFPDGHALHSHMMMTGSWHLYRPGERWQLSPRAARVVMTFADVVAICFSAPEIRWLSPERLVRDRWLGELGASILAPDFDPSRAFVALRSGDDLPLGEAVMDQRRIAGIGNIYKSESLFLAKRSPFVVVSTFDDAALVELLAIAQRLMRASVEGRSAMARTLHPRARYWAYRRAKLPCLVCATTIAMDRQGTLRRSTYWCPRCQGAR